MEREYQKAYIDSLHIIPIFRSTSFNYSLPIQRFIYYYPDFFPLFKGKVGRDFSFYMSEKLKNNEYILSCADLLTYIFKDNPEIPEIIHYIMANHKLKNLEKLQETKHDYYQIIKAYGNKFCYIAGYLEDFYDGNLDLPIYQLFDEEHCVMLNSASPLQQIVSYILNN